MLLKYLLCVQAGREGVCANGRPHPSRLSDNSQRPSSSFINFMKTFIGFKCVSWKKNAFIGCSV